MEKIKELLKKMIKNNRKIILINFCFNKIGYFLILEQLEKLERKNQYASMKLTFIRKTDQERITIEANSNRFLIESEALITYFRINSIKINNFLKYLFAVFISHIPENIPNLNEEEERIIVNYINREENEEEKIYCIGLMRNGIDKSGKQRLRRPLNLEKTRILYPELYEDFKNDKTISFRYSSNIEDRKSYREILENFSN